MPHHSLLLLHVANSTSLYLLIDIQSLLDFPPFSFLLFSFLPFAFFLISYHLFLFYFISSPLLSFSFPPYVFALRLPLYPPPSLFFYILSDVLSPSNSHPLLQSPSSFHLSLISLNSNPFFLPCSSLVFMANIDRFQFLTWRARTQTLIPHPFRASKQVQTCPPVCRS